MTQQHADPVQQGLSYMRHQGAKSFPDIDAMLERTAGDWGRCLEGLSEQQATYQPAGEWCAKEVLGHVILTDRSINQDIAGLAGIEAPADRVEEARAMGLQSGADEALSIEDLRDRVAVVFNESRKLAATLAQSERLESSFPHPIFGPLNLKEWLAFHRIHSMDHIQQIDKIKADPGYPSA